jgi:hypothetical protein
VIPTQTIRCGKGKKEKLILEYVKEDLQEPTLKLLQVHGLDVATSQIFYMSDQGIGILPCIVWKPRDEVLEALIVPGVVCQPPESFKRIRILQLS